MGWLILALLAGVSALALWLLKVPRTLGSFVAAAMMLGATGYALVGSPRLPDQPVASARQGKPIDSGLIEAREALFGRITFARSYLYAADAMMRRGKTDLAAKVLIAGLRKAPRDPSLWSSLGLAFVENDGGAISPAARNAFANAIRVSPRHPGPYFYIGLAQVRTGDLRAARTWWLRSLERTPEGSQARVELAVRLALLDQLLAQQDR